MRKLIFVLAATSMMACATADTAVNEEKVTTDSAVVVDTTVVDTTAKK